MTGKRLNHFDLEANWLRGLELHQRSSRYERDEILLLYPAVIGGPMRNRTPSSAVQMRRASVITIGPVTSLLRFFERRERFYVGAENGNRTRDINLGKVAFYL